MSTETVTAESVREARRTARELHPHRVLVSVKALGGVRFLAIYGDAR